MKQFTIVKVLVFSALYLANFSAFAMENEGRRRDFIYKGSPYAIVATLPSKEELESSMSSKEIANIREVEKFGDIDLYTICIVMKQKEEKTGIDPFQYKEKENKEKEKYRKEYERDLSFLRSKFDKKSPYSKPYSRWLERFKMGRCKDQEATAKRNEFIHNLIKIR